MSNIIDICDIKGNLFQKIKYNDFNDLEESLKLFIIQHDSDILIQLMLKNDNLNTFDIINHTILSRLNDNDIITIVFIQKKELYCLGNIDGNYILDHRNDNYSRLLSIIIEYYNNNSYNIIMNSSYKKIILMVDSIILRQ